MPKEHILAEALGLDIKTPLSQRCADFYVLEQLEHQLFPWDGDERFRRGLFPGAFGSDSRREMLAYSAQRQLEKHTKALADEFLDYILLACGGEVRYLKLQHNTKKMATTTAKKTLTHKGVFMGVGIVEEYLKNLVPDHMAGSMGRGLAWEKWWNLAATDTKTKEEGLRALAVTFSHPVWRTSGGMVRVLLKEKGFKWDYDVFGIYAEHIIPVKADLLTAKWKKQLSASVSIGGEKWATPAALAADYLAGKMTARTFVDRCWSIQHNGGSLFNKTYKGADQLMSVLELQAKSDDYRDLVVRTSQYVADLWKRYQVEVKGVTDPGVWEIITEDGFSRWVRDNGGRGCKWCYQEFKNNSNHDPCSSEVYCAYNPNRMHEHCAGYDEGEHECCDCGEAPIGYEIDEMDPCGESGHSWVYHGSWANCVVCGVECEHDDGFWLAGCMSCGWQCPHESYHMGSCLICGTNCSHPPHLVSSSGECQCGSTTNNLVDPTS